MIVKSQAGDFEIKVISFEKDDGNLVMVCTMGVWNARTLISPSDILQILKIIIKSKPFWLYLLALPFIRLRKLD